MGLDVQGVRSQVLFFVGFGTMIVGLVIYDYRYSSLKSSDPRTNSLRLPAGEASPRALDFLKRTEPWQHGGIHPAIICTVFLLVLAIIVALFFVKNRCLYYRPPPSHRRSIGGAATTQDVDMGGGAGGAGGFGANDYDNYGSMATRV